MRVWLPARPEVGCEMGMAGWSVLYDVLLESNQAGSCYYRYPGRTLSLNGIPENRSGVHDLTRLP
jgi:hypothetical protein